jgi:hypothetical protein
MYAEGCCLNLLRKQEDWLIFASMSLGNDDSPFGLNILFSETAVDHTVGFQLQGQFYLVGRHGLKIRRPIYPGHSVPHTSHARNLALDSVSGEGVSALELHVLNPVGTAGPTGALVA